MNKEEYKQREAIYDRRVDRFAKVAVTVCILGVATYFWFDERAKNAESLVNVTPTVEEYFELKTRLNDITSRYNQLANDGIVECDSLGLESTLKENVENSNNSVLESMKENAASLERAIAYVEANNDEVRNYYKSIVEIREEADAIKRLALAVGITPFVGFMAYLINSQLRLRSIKRKLKD
nr:hypothetical protein [Nanoarchaeum sp.]